MGYKQDQNGEREYSSFLRFQRSARLSPHQVRAARERAIEVAKAGGWSLLTDEEVDEYIQEESSRDSP